MLQDKSDENLLKGIDQYFNNQPGRIVQAKRFVDEVDAFEKGYHHAKQDISMQDIGIDTDDIEKAYRAGFSYGLKLKKP